MEQRDSGGKNKLLIVEDNYTIRLYLKILLSSEYDIFMADNGQEGIDMTISRMPDLVICDLMMPVKNGFEYCREIRQNPLTSHIPIIFLSAKTEDEDIIHGTEVGADDYLTKPFNPDLLKAKIVNLIRSRSHLKKTYQKAVSEPQPEPALSSEAEFMQNVAKSIRENMHDPLFGVNKLTALLDVSQPTLYRKVKQATGGSVVELIRNIRLEQAADLLSRLRYGVREVSGAVGYGDAPTFRKHFVAKFGVTPSGYIAAAKRRARGN